MTCGGKIWGLGLPPKFILLVWKVVHLILATKDVLLRRKIEVPPQFPMCGEKPETIEHMEGFGVFRIWDLILKKAPNNDVRGGAAGMMY